MKKYVFAVLAAIAGLVGSFWLPSAAQAYPDVRINLVANHQVLYSGETLTATGTANVDCSWDLHWDGGSRLRSGERVVSTFEAPEVRRVTKVVLAGSCDYTSPGSADPQTWNRRITVTVLPRAKAAAGPTSAGADLPGAGGPNLAVLLGGLGLLLAGATAVTVARRRAEEVELPGQTA